MRFQSAFLNTTYIIRPSLVKPDPITGQNQVVQTPLKAKFLGPQRIFDSENAQRKFGWSDEERKAVEVYLLSHRDFGKASKHARGGLYLAPGETLPQEYNYLVEKSTPLTAPRLDGQKRCAFISTGPDDVVQCEDPALEGEELCERHLLASLPPEGAPLPTP